MIYSYTIAPQTLATDENLVFTIDAVKTGCTVTHAGGTPTFTFNKPGFYFVTMTTTSTMSATTAS